VTELHTVMTGLAFGESPRWHEGRLWLCDWVAGEVLAAGADGTSEVVLRMPSLPFCIDWLPDGRLLVVSGREARVLRLEPSGDRVTHADLSTVSAKPWNEIAVDGRGNAYVNCSGFELGSEQFAPGSVALVTPDGAARTVADDLAFPNGMALTPDGATLVVAESYGRCLTAFDVDADGGLSGRRTWADLGDGVPDGICLDADGAIWYADVPNRSCARVREGGELLQRIALDRGGFSCALGGADGRTLFIVAAQWSGPAAMADGRRTGVVLAARAPAAASARPAR
jgi:sugar lactone lactonase YvrE